MNIPKTDLLKIDKDCFVNKKCRNNYVELILSECRKFKIDVIQIRTCNSKRKGVHFYIKIDPPIEAMLANEIQYLLGDDARRVDFNRARIESDLVEWNKLFEKPNVKLRTIYRR